MQALLKMLLLFLVVVQAEKEMKRLPPLLAGIQKVVLWKAEEFPPDGGPLTKRPGETEICR